MFLKYIREDETDFIQILSDTSLDETVEYLRTLRSHSIKEYIAYHAIRNNQAWGAGDTEEGIIFDEANDLLLVKRGYDVVNFFQYMTNEEKDERKKNSISFKYRAGRHITNQEELDELTWFMEKIEDYRVTCFGNEEFFNNAKFTRPFLVFFHEETTPDCDGWDETEYSFTFVDNTLGL